MNAPLGRKVGLALAMLTVSLPMLLRSQSQTIHTDELVRESDVIVVGSVGALKSEWNADRSRIQTVVTINISETVKGAAQGGTLTVVVPGGEVGDVGEWYSHTPRFQDTEEVVVFAKRDDAGVMRVAGGEHGKFQVTAGKSAGSRVIPNVGTLEEFTGRVKQAVRAQSVQGGGR